MRTHLQERLAYEMIQHAIEKIKEKCYYLGQQVKCENSTNTTDSC